MSDIFISYSSADRPRVKPLVAALEQHGWSVWWYRSILAGKTWDRVIEEALDSARETQESSRDAHVTFYQEQYHKIWSLEATSARFLSFTADNRGYAQVSVSSPLQMPSGSQLVLVFHSDGADHTSSIGVLGTNAHPQLITRVP